MNRTRLFRCLALLAVAAGLLVAADPAGAGSLKVDSFRDAEPDIFIYPWLNAAPWLHSANDPAEILGAERELSVEAIGGPSPPADSVKIVGAVGVDPGVGQEGILQVGTQDGYSARARLVYDGVDDAGLGGVDFTDGGTNDRIQFTFAWIASVGGFEATVIVTDTEGRQGSHTATFGDDGSPSVRTIHFSGLTGDPNLSLESVDSLEVLLNVAEIPNTDFALDEIEIVPEPASWSLLVVALAALAWCRGRRRRRVETNPD